MYKFIYLYFLFLSILFIPNKLESQENGLHKNEKAFQLLDSLWENPTSFFSRNDDNWRLLCRNLDSVNLNNLNNISRSIFYGKDAKIANFSDASDGLIGQLNKRSHKKKVKTFTKKIRNGFRDYNKFPNHKVVMMEGDSWFEYPVFLHDITDNLMEIENLAIYSIASAGDWVSNMIANHQYQFEYLKLKPEVFIISGGGNDIMGDNRLASFINFNPIDSAAEFLKNYQNYVILRINSKPVPMCNASYCPLEYHNYEDIMTQLNSNVDQIRVKHIVNGRRYLNKSYYRWLVSLKLEYKILFESIKKLDEERFESLKIITQGYDYPIPSFKERAGKSMATKNGRWIKEPLMMKGITDQQTQEDIIMTMIFDFNEMMIELGKEFDNIYHIDIRGFTQYLEKKDHKKKGQYWYDELHTKSIVYKSISESYEALIFDQFKNPHKVVNVIKHHQLGLNY